MPLFYPSASGGVGGGSVSVPNPLPVAQDSPPWLVNINNTVPVSGTVGATQSGTWTVQQGTPPWSVTQSGTWNVGQSGSPWLVNIQNTAAVSGTITANQGGAPWSVSQSGTWNVGQLNPPWLINVNNTAAVSGSVSILNFPSTQAVSGSITVLNLPTTVAVSGTVSSTQGSNPWLTNVQNTVAVSGLVSVTPNFGSTWSTTQSGTWTVQQGNPPWLVNVNNTAAVSGSITVSNLPATLAVSGTVTAIVAVVPGTLTTMISTELNSLTNSSITTPASIFNNTTGARFADFELLVTYGTNPTDGSQVDLYIVPSLDGTNYADGSSSIVAANNYSGSFILRATTSAQRLVLRDISIPSCKFKVHLKNLAGQTTSSSGNTLRMLPYTGPL